MAIISLCALLFSRTPGISRSLSQRMRQALECVFSKFFLSFRLPVEGSLVAVALVSTTGLALHQLTPVSVPTMLSALLTP